MRADCLRPLSFTLAWALALAALAPAAARAEVTVRTLNQETPAADVVSVGFHGQVGEIEVVGTSGGTVKLEVTLLCERERDRACREAAAKVDLEARRSGDRLQLVVEDWPKLRGGGLSFSGRLELPKHLAVEVDMGVGEVSVVGVEADIEVDTGVGEVSVEAQEALFRSVKMDTGVGEAELEVGDRTIQGSGFVGGHLSWRHGPGRGHIEIDSGVGEIRVVLR
ncbi:MAG TPA: hypothetical protein VJG13_14120 [Thermoanaerobaculia bacterium]|nr:hypothetical protein [Thermoanaerobaculia bacterium]